MRRLLLIMAALAVSPLAAAQKAPDSYPGGVYNVTPPTLADKQTTTLQFDTNGNLKTVSSGGGGGGTVTQGPQASTATGNTWFFQGAGALGTPAGGVLTIQGGSGMTPLGVTDTADYAQGSATSGQLGPLIQGAVTTAAPTYTNAQTSPLTMTTSGILRTGLFSTTGVSLATGFGGAAGAPATGVAVSGVFNSSIPTLVNGNGSGLQLDISGNLLISGRPITPVVSASAEASHVLKNAAGNLFSVYATNLTSTAGFLAVVNATTAPSTGTGITPLACVPLPASGVASLNYNPGPPAAYSTGITALVTSAANCFTFTSGTITAFISGSVQ